MRTRSSAVVPSAALAMSGLALLTSLSGAAYAVATIGPSDIRANAIGTSHIRDGQVTSRDVKDGHVTRADLASSARGLAGLQIVRSESHATGAEDHKVAVADCPAGKFAVGGGGVGSSPDSLALTDSFPAVSEDGRLPRGWLVAVRETESITAPWRVHAYVLCARVG